MRSTPKNKIDKKSNRIFHPSEGLTLASPTASKNKSDYNEQHLKLPEERQHTVTEHDESHALDPRHEIAVGLSHENLTDGSIEDSDGQTISRNMSKRGINGFEEPETKPN